MSWWNAFLNSLSTRGGAIFILLVLSGCDFWVTLHLIHHNEDGNMLAAGLVTTLGSFTGALLLALKGSSETTSTATVSPEGGASVRVSDGTSASAPPPPAVQPKTGA